MNLSLSRLRDQTWQCVSLRLSSTDLWPRVCLVVSTSAMILTGSVGHLLAAEQTFDAQSCEFSSVQEAVQSAIASGGPSLVSIPSGTCDWTSHMLKIPGGISLKGAGKTSTVIQGSSESNNALITIECSNRKTSRVSDLSLVGKGDATIWDGGLALLGGCKDFLVFNSTFRDFVNFGVSVRGNARGVVFDNEFVNNYRSGQTGGSSGYGVVVYGDGTWPSLELGTANAVFVENNFFSGNRHSIASSNGSRYVFRHNTVIGVDQTRDFHMVDAHGLSSSPRGSRSWEVYSNTVTTKLLTTKHVRSVVRMRGGDGVVFNNTVTNPGTISTMVELTLDKTEPYPAQDQMTVGYFWDNTPNTIRNGAPEHLVEGRDYFLRARPGYTPYTYPHPLRSTQTVATPP